MGSSELEILNRKSSKQSNNQPKISVNNKNMEDIKEEYSDIEADKIFSDKSLNLV